jgi:hypothetical protein
MFADRGFQARMHALGILLNVTSDFDSRLEV